MSVNDLISLSLDEIIARGGPKFRANRRSGTARREGGVRGFRGGVRRIPVVTNRVILLQLDLSFYFTSLLVLLTCKDSNTSFYIQPYFLLY